MTSPLSRVVVDLVPASDASLRRFVRPCVACGTDLVEQLTEHFLDQQDHPIVTGNDSVELQRWTRIAKTWADPEFEVDADGLAAHPDRLGDVLAAMPVVDRIALVLNDVPRR